MTPTIRTVLWMNVRGHEAAALYCDLIPNSRIVAHYASDSGPATYAVTDFLLDGVPYQILDAGPHVPLTEAVSIMVTTPDQAETDRLWAALTADGGQESRCGWLKDRFGLSWQITPEPLLQIISGPDRERAGRAMAALMTMRKIDLAAILAA
jgi:predicted 3-demethylubiquinone-9 3-methyltransferase (glyoxalase superfamily)